MSDLQNSFNLDALSPSRHATNDNNLNIKLNDKNITSSLNKNDSTPNSLYNKNNRSSNLTVSSIDNEESYEQNNLVNEETNLERTISKDSLIYPESQEVKHKQPIMGKNALLRKSLTDPSDSCIIQNIILNKYENILNYYVNRMYTRRLSRMSNRSSLDDDDANSINGNYNQYENSNDNENNKDFSDKKLKFMKSTEYLNHEMTEGLNNSFTYNNDVDVISTYSEYDPRRFLVDALGDDVSMGEVEHYECASVTHLREGESIGTSQVSSLLSSNQSFESTLTRNSKRKQSKHSSKIALTENENVESILERYKTELSKQHSIIFQISKALHYCKSSKFFVGIERIEAEKILLVATLSKEAILNEINMIEFDTCVSKYDSRCLGEIKLSNITFHLKEKSELEQDCDQYYLVVMRCGKTVLASEILKEIDNTVSIRKTFCFLELPTDFEITIGVYCFVINSKDYFTQGSGFAGLPSPKKILKCNKQSKIQNRNHFVYTETTSFIPLGKCHIKNTEISKLDDIDTLNLKWYLTSTNASIQPNFELRMKYNYKLANNLTGFLTLGGDKGTQSWNRRWCVLEGFLFKYWNYPSEESVEPIDVIDLRFCATQEIRLADRVVCARPKTLLLQVKVFGGIRNYFLSADSQEELKRWERDFNFVIQSLMFWKGMK